MTSTYCFWTSIVSILRSFRSIIFASQLFKNLLMGQFPVWHLVKQPDFYLRVVNEIHSSATKNNKEWQDKLPLVVLKAEEIMYSKANSEAEYMDLETLPDRDSDTINTIIRRDEASESGDFLPPLY
ncbi:Histone acetyltransferase [Cinnamomum micranthum f. kanehirae]|uniref:Histone acetyltransferase n=1 Tax=Cinnamomum micranthum f. kanehirae TaxID=337451 RepID=A0A443PRV6_9MAGN|nr:Histone acetyltransferase [Cinnamomum micranthum f. kanehirae]